MPDTEISGTSFQSEFSNLVDLARAWSNREPRRVVYSFLADGDFSETSLTYHDLDRRAQTFAAALQARGATGERVLLLYPPGLEYITAFFGCLYAGAICVPAYMVGRGRNVERLLSIITDCRPRFALTTSRGLVELEQLAEKFPQLRETKVLATDQLDDETSEWQTPRIGTDSLAFLQYTSGSVSAPKGVMVTHGNLLHNEALIQRAFRQTENSIIVSWLPLFHDMGLIGSVLQPMYLGGRAIIFSPSAFLQRPLRWLETISHYRATTSGGPNFGYELCLQRIGEEELSAVDLSSWTTAFNGAEPVFADTLERFAAKFKRCGFSAAAFQPCYGLAETTLFASGEKRSPVPAVRKFASHSLEPNATVEIVDSSDEGRSLISCGASSDRITIVHPETLQVCRAGEVGEIWISGPSVTPGYWNRPDETEQTFNASLAGKRYLRTGDLGFQLDGELFVTGRLKELIIIRGRNYYPHDFERAAELSHPALRRGCSVAFSTEAAFEQRLFIVCEVEDRKNANLTEISDHVAQAISDAYELQAHVLLVKPRTIPRTSSGKPRRNECRARFGVLDNGPQAKVEADFSSEAGIANWLRLQLATRLHVSADRIDLTQPIVRYGLDSITAVDFAHEIQKVLQVNLPLASLLNESTIAEMAAVAFRDRAAFAPAAVESQADANDPFPLSAGQQALWYLEQMAPEISPFIIPVALRIDGELNVSALARSFQRLTDRHPMLRTTFHSTPDGPVQRVHERMDVDFQERQVSDGAIDDEIRNELKVPFKFAEGSLLRLRLYTGAARQNVLLLLIHHIVSDFWSLARIAAELELFYQSEIEGTETNLPSPRLQYKDLVQRESNMLRGAEGERLFTYWQKHLGNELPLLNLPTDRARANVVNNRGAWHSFELDAELTANLKQLSRAQGVTLYVTLLAAFNVLLHRYTSQSNILIGTPMAGRERVETTDVVGFLVNTVVLRTDVSPTDTFAALLVQVRKTVLDAFAHQEYPLPLLVARLQPDRDAKHPSLFQTMFVLQKSQLVDEQFSLLSLKGSNATLSIAGLKLRSLDTPAAAVDFDLTLTMAEADRSLKASFTYNASLFAAETIERLARHFQLLLQSIVANPTARLSELQFLRPAERRQILYEWNETYISRTPQLLHELIEQQAQATPEAVAVVYENESLTYRELEQRANQLAHYLRERGVGPDVLVGICLERSLELVVGPLGILKAGGAYVPLEPDYPRDRLQLMIADAGLGLVLTKRVLRPRLPEAPASLVCLDELDLPVDYAAVDSQTSEANLAYMIYTSGSTGRPKGVMITHDAIVNRLLWMQHVYKLDSSDTVLQKTPFSFDVSVWEFFWPLLTGARLVLARPHGHQEPDYLQTIIVEQGVTTLHFVPSMLHAFIQLGKLEDCTTLRRVFSSGEALSPDLAALFLERSKAKLHNLYGPTEAAVDVTYWECKRSGKLERVPIGRPIANTQMYVLDRGLQPVPPGVAGELYIGGAGLARGYFGAPALTAEKFLPDPFGAAGSRLYRTGDLARFLSDGEIEYLGRFDEQIKLRGFRIELGEIEACLRSDQRVKEAAVLLVEHSGEKQLVAFVSPTASEALDDKQLRERLKQQLPGYMVPATIIILPQLPLTANGKLDRKQLLSLAAQQPQRTRAYLAPRTEVEEIVAGIWSTVLNLEQVSIDDNFFELGGHSLLATQITSQVRARLGAEIPLSVLFGGTPTVAEMSKAIETHQIMSASADEIADVLSELEGLSDAELSELLAREKETG